MEAVPTTIMGTIRTITTTTIQAITIIIIIITTIITTKDLTRSLHPLITTNITVTAAEVAIMATTAAMPNTDIMLID